MSFDALLAAVVVSIGVMVCDFAVVATFVIVAIVAGFVVVFVVVLEMLALVVVSL